MKFTLVVEDKVAGIDGEFVTIDVSSLPSNVRAVQWDGTQGHIEYNDETPNKKLVNINAFSHIIDQVQDALAANNVEPQVDTFTAQVTALLSTFPILPKKVVDDVLLTQYKNILVDYFIRRTDNNVIGVTITSAEGLANGSGAIALLSCRRVVEVCAELGIPFFAELMPRGGITQQEFTTFFEGLGCASIVGPFSTFVYTQPTPQGLFVQQANAVRVALQDKIDEKARGVGFSDGNSLMLYAGFENPFQAQAIIFAKWEASVWYKANLYEQEVTSGTKPMLTPSEAVALMPEFPV